MSGSSRPRLEWPGRRRSPARVALLFAVTAGAYWPLWLAQVIPFSRSGAAERRGRAAIAIAALLPGVNAVLEIMLALFLPRAVRRLADRRGVRAADTEVQTFLLLAAPFAAIAITLALGLPWWAAGYLAWPLELPAALFVQHALNRLEPATRRPPVGADAEILAAGAIGAVLVAALVIAIVSGDGEEKQTSPPPAPAESVSDLAATPGALWVTKIEENAVVELDKATLRPTGRRARVGRSPYDIAAGFGALWVAGYRSDGVSRVDPRSARATGAPLETGRGPFGVTVGFGSVWVTNEVDRNLVEIDPRRNVVKRKVTVGLAPRGVDAGAGAVWVAGAGSTSVVRVDPRSRAKERIRMPAFCQDVAVGGGSVWAAIPEANAIVRVDARTGQRIGLISVGIGPSSVDYGAGSVWVANGADGTVTRIDASTGRVVGRPWKVGDRLNDIAVSGDTVYVLRADGVVRRLRAR
jgi:DNA-binding beta-propeller fold protein YncE